MTCFHPKTAWQNPKADLFESSHEYYKNKKISFKYIPGWTKIEIPCNHCLGCKLDHANMWATRIMLEAKQWDNCCVISLTYNDPNLHLTETGKTTLKKQDLQNFMKRLRYFEQGIQEWINPINEKREKPIRFFACGEYGTKGTRAKIGGNPHFHVIFFNWRPNDLKKWRQNEYGDWIYTSEKLKNIWSGGKDCINSNRGFTTVEDLNYNTACYVARYVQKKAGIKPQKRIYTDEISFTEEIDERNGQLYEKIHNKILKNLPEQEPEFLDMSRGVGIGRVYWNENKEKIKRNKGILLKIKDKIKLKQIPRYYKKLWERENYEEYYRFKYEIGKDFIRKKAEIIATIKTPNENIFLDKWEFYLENQEKILKVKADKGLKRNKFI